MELPENLPEGVTFIDLSSPTAMEDLRAAIGITSNQVIVCTPQFTRTDGMQVSVIPEDFNALRSFDTVRLRNLGLQLWEARGGEELWLFPAEWYPHIPEDFRITSIAWATSDFQKGETCNDQRYGALSFGIVVPVAKSSDVTGVPQP